MVAKRQLRSLEIKKEKSVEKVNSFLKNLDSIKTAKRRSGTNPTSHQDQPFQTPKYVEALKCHWNMKKCL